MNTRVVGITQLDEQDLERWRDLANASLEPNVSFHPDLLIPACEHVPGSPVSLVIAVEEDRFLGLLPLRIMDRWQGYPVRALTTRHEAAWRLRTPTLGPPLVRPERAKETVSALIDAAAEYARSQGVALLLLEHLYENSLISRSIQRRCEDRRLRMRGIERWQVPVLYRREDHDYRTSVLHRQRMKDLAKKERRVARTFGSAAVLRDRGSDPEAMEDFLRMEASGWKGETRTASIFDTSVTKFQRDVCRRLAPSGRHHLLSLEADATPLAMMWCIESSGWLFWLKMTYEAKHAAFSPGAQLEVRTIELFQESLDASMIHPCSSPDNAFHHHFLPDRLPYVSFVIALGGQGALLVIAYPVITRLRPVLRPLIRRWRKAARSGHLRRHS